MFLASAFKMTALQIRRVEKLPAYVTLLHNFTETLTTSIATLFSCIVSRKTIITRITRNCNANFQGISINIDRETPIIPGQGRTAAK